MKSIFFLILVTTSAAAQLIDPPNNQAVKAQAAAEQIISRINGEIDRRVRVHQEAFDTLWHNRDGASPDAILAQLGTKAGLIFKFSAENIDHIDRCAKIVGKTAADFLAAKYLSSPRALVFHDDGSVTLAEP